MDWAEYDKLAAPFRPACEGPCAVCEKPAEHKVGEELRSVTITSFSDAFPPHNLTAQLCGEHFRRIFQPYRSTT